MIIIYYYDFEMRMNSYVILCSVVLSVFFSVSLSIASSIGFTSIFNAGDGGGSSDRFDVSRRVRVVITDDEMYIISEAKYCPLCNESDMISERKY